MADASATGPSLTCGNCMFFRPGSDDYEDPEFGACRRYPPQVIHYASGFTKAETWKARFPSVRPIDWCGEWKQSPG